MCESGASFQIFLGGRARDVISNFSLGGGGQRRLRERSEPNQL